MKSILTKIMSLVLSLLLIVSSTTPVLAVRDPGAGGGVGFFDGLDAFGNATATIGCVLNVGSVLATADWSDPGGVCLGVIDSIFGTSFGGDPMQEKLDAMYSDIQDIKETTGQIKDGVDYLKQNSIYVNQQLSIINGSLNTVNSQLLRQTQKLGDIHQSIKQMNQEMTQSFTDLNNLIEDSTEKIQSTVYMSTAEINKSTALNNALQSYSDSYSALYTYENNILESLGNRQDSYTAFYNAILKLDNGREVIEALNSLTLKPDSVSNLSPRQQKLLRDTNVKVGSRNVQVLKYHQDYMDDLGNFITDNVYTLNGNIGNIGDTAIAMGDYLTASNQNFNSLTGGRGIGEMYYIYQTYLNEFDKNGQPLKRDSDTVHRNYRAFMDSMVSQYMTTAWLAEMAFGYKIAQEAIGGNNATTIRHYEQYLNNVHAQMLKVSAYYDYEYKKCINDYDFGGDASGHDQDLVFYGNTASNGAWSVVRKNETNYPSGISESSLVLALGEEKELHYYYKYADVSARREIEWTSSDPTVAAVNSTGKVLGLSRGVATITAKYKGTEASCLISIGDVMAIENSDGVNRYHYYTYRSENGEWVTDANNYYDVESDRGYDYYYGITTYRTDAVELSEDTRSASLIASTGMSQENMDAFTWITAGDDAVQMNGYEISAVSGGWTEVIGYKKNEDAHSYDFIGIPVHSSMDTIIKDNGFEYSDYVEISSAADLIALANNPDGWGEDAKYVLTTDIDLGGMEWSPIGYCIGFGGYYPIYGYIISDSYMEETAYSWSAMKPFKGIFDGNGHTISNFKITRFHHLDAVTQKYQEMKSNNKKPSQYNNNEGYKLSIAQAGLFGLVHSGNIKDLNVTDAVIDIDTQKGVKDEKGQTFKLDDTEVTFDDDFVMFAGGMVGANYWNPYAASMRQDLDKYFGGSFSSGVSEESFEKMKEEVTLPDYLSGYLNREMNKASTPEEKEKARESYASILMMCKALQSEKEKARPCLKGCYADGNVKVKNTAKNGYAYSGLLSGGSTNDMVACTAIGSVQSDAKYGGSGGLVGVQHQFPGSRVEDCISYADVTASGGADAGGLIGSTCGVQCVDSGLNISEERNPEIISEWLGILLFLTGLTLDNMSSVADYSNGDYNAVINGNKVLGSVAASRYAGGLIGSKVSGAVKDYESGDVEKMAIAIPDYSSDDPASSGITSVYYNADITENYVACDVRSGGGVAGGIIGYSRTHATKAEIEDEIEIERNKGNAVTYNRGNINMNYYTGKVDAGAGGYAAGIIGSVIKEYSELQQNISAATELKGGSNVSYAVNGKNNGITFVNASGTNGALCYKLGGQVKDDGSTRADVARFNDPATYIRIFGDRNYLDLSGGLKPNGESGLDLLSGLVPKKLDNRYRFPVETVPHSYHQGDNFVKVNTIYKYTGTGTEQISSGVKSTTPDMSKIGVQTVTLSYGDFTDTYDVYIYPTAGYLKLTSTPAVKKDGSGISGGGLTLYENGSAGGRAVSLANCTVTRNDEDIFIIKNGYYSTAFRPVFIDIYTNSVNDSQAEYVGTEYYAPGASADVSAMLPATKVVNGKTYNLIATSSPVTFTADTDTCILSYYDTDNTAATGESISKATVKGIKNKTWTGKALTQNPTITLSGKKLKKGTDYTISYKNNKNVGKATVTIKGTGKYTGTIAKTFQINPKGTTIAKLTPSKNAATVKWKKQATKMSRSRVKGYQIQYCVNKSFKKNSKTITVKGYKKVSKKLNKLKSGKKYYVRIRTYTTVKGVKYYSPWSKTKTVKVK